MHFGKIDMSPSFYYGMGTSTGCIAGLQPYKVEYYNRMLFVVLQILIPRFTNFYSAFYKFLTPRFTIFGSAFCKSTPLRVLQVHSTPRFTNPLHSAFYKSTPLCVLQIHSTPHFTNPLHSAFYKSTPLRVLQVHSTPRFTNPLHSPFYNSTPLLVLQHACSIKLLAFRKEKIQLRRQEVCNFNDTHSVVIGRK